MSARVYVGIMLLACLPSSASAQHHHHHHHHHHYGHHHYHGSYYGNSNWNYVVPNTQYYSGAYYVQGNSYYYTPSPVVYANAAQPAYSGYGVAPAQQSFAQQSFAQQSVALQYGGFSYCNDLTGRLEAQLNLLCLELHYNYQHNPDFAQTYREAYSLLQQARQMHALDHQGQRDAIRQAVTSVDQQYHHIQSDIANWTRQNNRHLPPGDALQKAANGEAILHHLCYDVGIQPHVPGARLPNVELAPAPGPTPGT